MNETIAHALNFHSNENAVSAGITDSATKVQKSISRTQQVCNKFGDLKIFWALQNFCLLELSL